MTAKTSDPAYTVAVATRRSTRGIVPTLRCTPTRRTTSILMLKGTAARTLAGGTKRMMTKMQGVDQMLGVRLEVPLGVPLEVPLGVPLEVPLVVLPGVPLEARLEVLLEAQCPEQGVHVQGLPAQ